MLGLIWSIGQRLNSLCFIKKHASKKINIKLKTVLSKKIIQLGFTSSESCLAVTSCGTWDLELITLCFIFPSEKWNNILLPNFVNLSIYLLFMIHSLIVIRFI